MMPRSEMASQTGGGVRFPRLSIVGANGPLLVGGDCDTDPDAGDTVLVEEPLLRAPSLRVRRKLSRGRPETATTDWLLRPEPPAWSTSLEEERIQTSSELRCFMRRRPSTSASTGCLVTLSLRRTALTGARLGLLGATTVYSSSSCDWFETCGLLRALLRSLSSRSRATMSLGWHSSSTGAPISASGRYPSRPSTLGET